MVGFLTIATSLCLAGACGSDSGTGPEEDTGFTDLTGLFTGTVTPEGATNSFAASLGTTQSGTQVAASLTAGAMTGTFAVTLSGSTLTGAGATSITCDDANTVTDDQATLDLTVSSDLARLTGTLGAKVCLAGGGSAVSTASVNLSR